MSRRAKSICRKVGCSKLIDAPGYCDQHLKSNNSFQYQNNNKTIESKKFYSSSAWTGKSKQHRADEPLCQECLKNNTITAAQMVHHNPDLTVLLKKGLNPLDDKYLESLCNNCHLGHLREKKH